LIDSFIHSLILDKWTDCRTACNRASVLSPIQACNRTSCSRTCHVQDLPLYRVVR